jgi:hypothetical protein
LIYLFIYDLVFRNFILSHSFSRERTHDDIFRFSMFIIKFYSLLSHWRRIKENTKNSKKKLHTYTCERSLLFVSQWKCLLIIKVYVIIMYNVNVMFYVYVSDTYHDCFSSQKNFRQKYWNLFISLRKNNNNNGSSSNPLSLSI